MRDAVGAVARTGALLLGGLAVLNVVRELGHPGFDANLWWIDLRIVAAPIRQFALMIAGGLILAAALRPRCSPVRKWATRIALTGLLIAAVGNTVAFYQIVGRRQVEAGFPVPFSAFLIVPLMLLAVVRWFGDAARPWSRMNWVAAALTVSILAGSVPVAHMLCFGCTDYRRQADAAVVFGAKVFPDGRPSLMLADRTRTACDLYQLGLVRKLIFSGGPGAGATHETEAMRQMALARQIPNEDILIDREGLNTQETVTHVRQLAERHGLKRLLAVSHFYHLPRIKLTFHSAGMDVFTVPAQQTHTPRFLAWYMARETAALWTYYLRSPAT